MINLQTDVYKSYRHPKLERFAHLVGSVLTTLMTALATYCLFGWVGPIWAFFIIFLYFLLTKMRMESIYFYDDKGFGPGRLCTFIENTSTSFKNALVPFAIAYTAEFIKIWMVK